MNLHLCSKGSLANCKLFLCKKKGPKMQAIVSGVIACVWLHCHATPYYCHSLHFNETPNSS